VARSMNRLPLLAAKENKWQRGNATRWHNEAYDNLFHSAEGELDPVKRAALFFAMNDMVVEAGVAIPEQNKSS
jgi:peptide/nickel transport system substrate-binding protein